MLVIKTVVILAFVASAFGRPQKLSEDGKRLIKLTDEDDATWLSEDEIFSLIRTKTHFMDITDRIFPTFIKNVPTTALPVNIRFQATVRQALTKLNITRLESFVSTFDTFPNRYYNSQNGVNASNWLFSQISDSIANSGYNGTATVRMYTHSWLQNSIVARIQGSDESLNDELVIFGAHLDSINSGNPIQGIAPGSDDNASGSVTVLEALRIFLESGVIPKRSIEFQWYAAEEVGLRGSGDIAEAYFIARTKIVAMVNYDVVGYEAGAKQIAFLTDHTNATLSSFLKLVTEEYCTYEWVDDYCGYACTDHASFNAYGFPAASPNEFPLNPYMHTVQDTRNRMSFEQVAEFVKLTVGAAIEIAEPTTVV